jgi:D-arabinose 1-dehydrogenase-like Zn-dependent alcohol dehydrogenase
MKVAAGADVKKFKVGDFAAIGCMVDSCLSCNNCKQGNEQYCSGTDTGGVLTYNGRGSSTGAVLTYNVKYDIHQFLLPCGGCFCG